MLSRIPRWIPSFADLVADIGNPPSIDLARRLGVPVDQVDTWRAGVADAPRPVCLALFWLTRWGLSELDAELANAARVHQAHAAALSADVARLRRELARVAALADAGAANAPRWRRPVLQLVAC